MLSRSLYLSVGINSNVLSRSLPSRFFSYSPVLFHCLSRYFSLQLFEPLTLGSHFPLHASSLLVSWCAACRAGLRESRKMPTHSTRNLCSRAEPRYTKPSVRDEFLSERRVTERHGRSISPSRHWSRSRRTSDLPPRSVHPKKRHKVRYRLRFKFANTAVF